MAVIENIENGLSQKNPDMDEQIHVRVFLKPELLFSSSRSLSCRVCSSNRRKYRPRQGTARTELGLIP